MRLRTLVALAALLAACKTRKEPAPVSAVPSEIAARSLAPDAAVSAPSASSFASAAPAAATAAVPWKGPPAKAWTDPRVVAALAADCDFVPPPPGGDADVDGQAGDLFRCTTAFEQSCVFNPCVDEGESCKSDCGKTCNACGATCSNGCKTCKTSCTDDACRQACAKTCAQCKQDCTRGMDRCTSGACTKVYATCTKKLTVAFATQGCKAACERLDACRTKCPSAGDDAEPCFAKCNDVDGKLNACRAACGTDDDRCRTGCVLTSGCSTLMCEIEH